ncbi:MAG TPA: sulfatase-like hydrolase/transferase, partial [Jiangellaceae bacterium]
APHHVATSWSDKYKGRFDQGWDRVREETFARQQELGVIPADAQLTARPSEIPAWDDMPDEMKPVLAREMEVYAGFLEHTDHNIGRLVDALTDLEILDDTLIYLIIGDNGASAEGTLNGTFNEMLTFNGAFDIETPEFLAARIDKFGTPEAYNHYAVGWAHAMDTPYQWTKQVASHWGGTRNGLIVHWPHGIRSKGEIRSQFHRVIDIAATVLDAGASGADARTRRRADAAAWGHDGADLRRRRCARTPRNPVLRDVLQPRHLQRRLDRGHPAQHAVGSHLGHARVRGRRVGALRTRRLEPGARPVGRAAGEAEGVAGAVP